MLVAPEEQIGYLLKRLNHSFRNMLDGRLRQDAPGMSFAHLVTLDLLDGQPGLPGAQLAKRLLVTAQTMNQMLQRLEVAGEIERRPHPENRRADRWFLTEAGRRKLLACRNAARPVMTQMLSRLEGAQIAQLRHFLEQCVAALEATPGPAPAATPTRTARARPRRKHPVAMQRLKGSARNSSRQSIARKPARR
jgi:DNA-binding MarR family transcriptional regulator